MKGRRGTGNTGFSIATNVFLSLCVLRLKRINRLAFYVFRYSSRAVLVFDIIRTGKSKDRKKSY